MARTDCKFCAIARGEAGARIVLEGERTLAFLDHRPLFPGHVLVIPRDHHETMRDLPPDLLAEMFADARRLAVAVEDALGAEGSFVAVNNRVSQSVPHLHTHVVPRNRKDGLRGFFWPRGKYESPDEAEAMAATLRAALSQARR